tara:strand:+ start:881 stop:1288 length:408 start_codon:yes stop_codon:yes gene_type:complete
MRNLNLLKNRINSKSLNDLNKLKARLDDPRINGTREQVATLETKLVANNIGIPQTPITCSGTSFQCNVAGSGKTKIVNVSTTPQGYDHLGTPIKEGGMLGKSYQPDIILNTNNNSIATKFSKNSLKNSYGFENFQ